MQHIQALSSFGVSTHHVPHADIATSDIEWRSDGLVCFRGTFDQGNYQLFREGYCYAIDAGDTFIVFSIRVGLLSPFQVINDLKSNERTKEKYRKARALHMINGIPLYKERATRWDKFINVIVEVDPWA